MNMVLKSVYCALVSKYYRYQGKTINLEVTDIPATKQCYEAVLGTRSKVSRMLDRDTCV